jgi:hypothetical protein
VRLRIGIKKLSKIICLITILCIVFSSCTFDRSKEVPEAPIKESDVIHIEYEKEFIEKFYKEKDIDSWWEIVAIKAAGGDIPSDSKDMLDKKSASINAQSQATDYAGCILGYLCMENDPTDLLIELAKKQQDDGSFGPINAHIWSMIALDTAAYTYDTDKAITYILSKQNEDGAYAFEGSSDPDMTGMAMIALSNHRDRAGVEEAIDRAISYLKAVQLTEGGFESLGSENSNSISTVISGLIAAGEDINSSSWIKNGNTMLDALMRFRLDDGSFSYLLKPKKYSQMATYQSFIAIFDIQNGESIWQSLGHEWEQNSVARDDAEDEKDENIESVKVEEKAHKDKSHVEVQKAEKSNKVASQKKEEPQLHADDAKEDGNAEKLKKEEVPKKVVEPPKEQKIQEKTEEKIGVHVKVIGYGGKVFFDDEVELKKDEANGFSAIKATKLPYKSAYGDSYISSINGEAEFEHGDLSGWKFKINAKIPNMPAIDCELSKGDRVEWWYALTAESTGPGE